MNDLLLFAINLKKNYQYIKWGFIAILICSVASLGLQVSKINN